MKRAKPARTKNAPKSTIRLLATIPEAAKALGFKSRNPIYERIADGRLEAIDIAGPNDSKTILRIPWDVLDSYVADCPRIHQP